MKRTLAVVTSTTDLSSRTSGPLAGAPASRSGIRGGRAAVQVRGEFVLPEVAS